MTTWRGGPGSGASRGHSSSDVPLGCECRLPADLSGGSEGEGIPGRGTKGPGPGVGHFRVAGRPRWEAGAGWSSWGQQDVEVGLSLTWCSDRRVNLACGFPHTALSWPPWLALPPGGGWLWPSPCSAALGAVAVTPPDSTGSARPAPRKLFAVPTCGSVLAHIAGAQRLSVCATGSFLQTQVVSEKCCRRCRC